MIVYNAQAQIIPRCAVLDNKKSDLNLPFLLLLLLMLLFYFLFLSLSFSLFLIVDAVFFNIVTTIRSVSQITAFDKKILLYYIHNLT